MDKPTTIQEAMEQMPSSFQASKAGNTNASVQFNLTGEGGGTWTVKIADGKCEAINGPVDAPTTTLTAAASDYLAMVRGELNAMSAFTSGKLKIAGDMMLMMKFQSWFA
jgi:putative sterol carrier protein